MTSPDLPSDLRAALERLGEGLSRRDTAQRAARMSATYRGGGGSQSILDAQGALAYVFTRMPATYAALSGCFAAIGDSYPGFAPTSLLDVGAGPGTAAWAAAESFASLRDFTLLDANSALRSLALRLSQDNARLHAIDYRLGDAQTMLAEAPDADLVTASYIVGELNEKARLALAQGMWRRTRDILLIVEPGTPSGYARIIELRDALIAAGAHIVAPCPHEADCPLQPPDWCHFSRRLARLRDHKQIKGAELPFEDEKFSYIALSRTTATQRGSRILAVPRMTKTAVTTKLCTADGLALAIAPRRDRPAYAQARKRRWGDLVRFQGIS